MKCYIIVGEKKVEVPSEFLDAGLDVMRELLENEFYLYKEEGNAKKAKELKTLLKKIEDLRTLISGL